MTPKKRKNQTPSTQAAKRSKTTPVSPGDPPSKVCKWLKTIGLKTEYIDTFQHEGVDGTELLYDVDMRLLLCDFKMPQLRAKRLLQSIETLRRNLPEVDQVLGLECDHCGHSTHGVPHAALNDPDRSICWDCFLYQSSYGDLPTRETIMQLKEPEESENEEEEEEEENPKPANQRKLKDSYSILTSLSLFDLGNENNHNCTSLRKIPGVTRTNAQTILDEIKGGSFTLQKLHQILNETTDGIICWENWRKKHMYVKYKESYLGHDQQISSEKPPDRVLISSWDLDLREETPPAEKERPKKKRFRNTTKSKPSAVRSKSGKNKKDKTSSRKSDKSKSSKSKKSTKSKSKKERAKPKPKYTDVNITLLSFSPTFEDNVISQCDFMNF